MKQVLTIVCKLNPSQKVVKKFNITLEMFAAACNYANQEVKPSITSKTTIQSQVYQTIREKFDLSANLAVRACARVGANRKTAKKDKKPVKAFKPTSADYDARIFAFREKDWFVSLTLVGGREHIPILSSNYQIGKLKGSKPTSAQLCKHKVCMHLGLRSGKRFKCTNSGCGWHGDADENASYNLSIIGASVSKLRGSDCLSCELSAR